MKAEIAVWFPQKPKYRVKSSLTSVCTEYLEGYVISGKFPWGFPLQSTFRTNHTDCSSVLEYSGDWELKVKIMISWRISVSETGEGFRVT